MRITDISHKMNLLDIWSTSSHYFCRKWIGETNENSNFDLSIKRVKKVISFVCCLLPSCMAVKFVPGVWLAAMGLLIRLFYTLCFRREGELLSRQKDVKKISELIYLELTVRMLPVFEIVQFENSPLQKLYREDEYKFWAQWFLGSFRIVWVDTRIGRWYLRQLWTNHK